MNRQWKQIRHTKGAKKPVCLVFKDVEDDGMCDTDKKFTEEPAPEFEKALQSFAKDVHPFCSWPKEFKPDAVTVRAVHIGGTAEEDLISIEATIRVSHGSYKVETPVHRPQGPEGLLPGFYSKAVTSRLLTLQKEAESYLKGNRQQGEMELDM